MSRTQLPGFSPHQAPASSPPLSTITGSHSSASSPTKSSSSSPTNPSMHLYRSTYQISSTTIPRPGICSPHTRVYSPPPNNLRTFGDRVFSVAAPNLWNSLSDLQIRSAVSSDTFKKQMKAYLFTKAYGL
ncbi:unnamed protein product [Lota lota]